MTLNITVIRIAIINASIKKTNSTLNHCAVPFINLTSFDIAIDKDQKINVIKIEPSIYPSGICQS